MQTNTVERTTDYDRFQFLPFNRQINKAHVNKLAEAINEKPDSGLYRPILVNEKMEIIDGQHRYLASKILGIPVYYLIGEGLTITDAQKLNAMQHNWTELDYAKSFAEAGDADYQKYLEIRTGYKLSHNVTTAYLTGSLHSGADAFRAGQFKIKHLEKSLGWLEKLQDAGQYYPDYRRKQFGLAYLTMITLPSYNHDHFLKRLAKYGDKHLRKFEILQDYQRAIEAIYNHNTPVDKQIKIF